MRAVVIERPHEAASREVDTPTCGPDDVLIKSSAAGLCRTDVEILEGTVPPEWVRYPCIPGHEWSGIVAAVGSQVSDIEHGARVVVEGMIPCNRCARCKEGATNLCANYDQLGFTRPGGYGEYVVAPRHVVHRLPDHVSADAAVLVEPASCVLRAMERAEPRPGDAIGVIGIGTLGSLALRLARLFGPRSVVAYGIRPEELELARRLGADHVIQAGADAEEVTRRAVGDGFDVVVETAGAPAAVDSATRLVRRGGVVALLGVAGGDRMLELPADRFVVKDVRVIGSLSYTTDVWTRVVRLLANRSVDLDPIVTHRFAARDFAAAMSFMDDRAGVVAKVVLEHD
jgi:L-iditol 2-dehydrogenase